MSLAKERSGKRRRASLVLVVEDDADFREMVRITLAGAGYVVTEAADGAEALKFLVSAGAPEPSVIVLDVQMPNMSGPELMKVLKLYDRLRRIPVIVTSTGARGADMDADTTWLPKPFDGARLIDLVGQMCAATRASNMPE